MNFSSSPLKFDPSRWLLSKDSPNPKALNSSSASAFNPFSLGPRNCLGRNLAYLEMRLILARLLWAFDLEAPESADGIGRWEDQKSWILWEKRPLSVRLRRRRQ